MSCVRVDACDVRLQRVPQTLGRVQPELARTAMGHGWLVWLLAPRSRLPLGTRAAYGAAEIDAVGRFKDEWALAPLRVCGVTGSATCRSDDFAKLACTLARTRAVPSRRSRRYRTSGGLGAHRTRRCPFPRGLRLGGYRAARRRQYRRWSAGSHRNRAVRRRHSVARLRRAYPLRAFRSTFRQALLIAEPEVVDDPSFDLRRDGRGVVEVDALVDVADQVRRHGLERMVL
jgi:hypothetical protein